MLDWRKIEAALATLARDWVEGLGEVLDERNTGDKVYALGAGGDIEINLTALAKDLAKELER